MCIAAVSDFHSLLSVLVSFLAGSIQAYKPNEGILDYATTKAAIVDFTKGLANQVIKEGIRVNCVAVSARETRRVGWLKARLGRNYSCSTGLDLPPCFLLCQPGPVWTPLVTASFQEEKLSKFGEQK